MNYRRRMSRILPVVAAAAAVGLLLIPADVMPDRILGMSLRAADPVVVSAVVEPIPEWALPEPGRFVPATAVAAVDRAAWRDWHSAMAEFVPASAAEVVEAVAVAPPGDSDRARVGKVAVNVRSGPSNTAPALFVLQPGDEVTLSGEEGGWIHVMPADGEEGWVYRSFLDLPAGTTG